MSNRHCYECGSDISDRHFNATLCKPCAVSSERYVRNYMTYTAKRSAERRALLATRTCIRCDATLERRQRNQARYCSEKCRRAAHRDRVLASPREVKRRNDQSTHRCNICGGADLTTWAKICSACAPDYYRGVASAKYHAAPSRHASSNQRQRQKLASIPSPNGNRPWSDEDIATALRHDIPVVQICYLLGRSYNQVMNRRRASKPGYAEKRAAQYQRRKARDADGMRERNRLSMRRRRAAA